MTKHNLNPFHETAFAMIYGAPFKVLDCPDD